MQIFDVKWKRKLEDWRISRNLIKRYMDVSRTLLPPITKRVLMKSMEDVEDYLRFTGETGEDFKGGWLPTLDTNLKMTRDNTYLI